MQDHVEGSQAHSVEINETGGGLTLNPNPNTLPSVVQPICRARFSAGDICLVFIFSICLCVVSNSALRVSRGHISVEPSLLSHANNKLSR
ncbi:unnamed protein product [Lupinus luteus]|uniref:Uncharacterized protein n=1 Tax=Lupinus luteus TaxID=3873 RepID=A0AAV1WYV2_LUPLU